MMKIKHLVITRFLNDESMNLGSRIFDKDVIDNGIHLFKTYLLPSLNNQSNKNFKLVVLINDKTKFEYLRELFDLDYDFDVNFVKNSEYKGYINKEFEDCDYFVTSRYDYDDMIYFNAVNDVQKSIEENSSPLYAYTWRNGCSHIDNTDLYKKFCPNYGNMGGMSIFLSLIVNKRIVNKPLTAYLYNHTKILEGVNKIYETELLGNIGERFIVNMDEGIKYVYVRHEFTDSTFTNGNDDINFNINKFFGGDE